MVCCILVVKIQCSLAFCFMHLNPALNANDGLCCKASLFFIPLRLSFSVLFLPLAFHQLNLFYLVHDELNGVPPLPTSRLDFRIICSQIDAGQVELLLREAFTSSVIEVIIGSICFMLNNALYTLSQVKLCETSMRSSACGCDYFFLNLFEASKNGHFSMVCNSDLWHSHLPAMLLLLVSIGWAILMLVL